MSPPNVKRPGLPGLLRRADRAAAFSEPAETGAEKAADAAIHFVGVAAALLGSAWLLGRAFGATRPDEFASLAIYCGGLVGMLAVSAAYNLAPPGRGKDILRRLDHAMIFVMIAGSYTPFAAARLGGWTGPLLCAGVWAMAGVGLAVKAAFPRVLERFRVALYLGMGWIMVAAFDPLVATVSKGVIALLVVGGVLYSLGVVFHLADRLRYSRAIWHAFVLVAACIHFSAISIEFVA